MKRRLEGLIAEHSLWHAVAKDGGYMPTGEEREAYPPARHPLVRRHPSSGRNALYIAATASHTAIVSLIKRSMISMFARNSCTSL